MLQVDKVKALTQMMEKSRYTVALCGSGMLEESGFEALKSQNRAYEIEQKYGASPEYIFSSAFYNTRPAKFFRFYKDEMLKDTPRPTDTAAALAGLEQKGKIQSIISANVYELCQRGGCKNVINLHGSIYHNKCSRCDKFFTMEEVLHGKDIPLCDACGGVIRPTILLFGEQQDNQLMTRAVGEIVKAEVLLLLGTNLHSEVFNTYTRHFQGDKLVIINRKKHFTDYKADLVIYDRPMNVMTKIVM